MSGSNNPYGGSYGGQMTASASFGAAPAASGPAGGYVSDTSTAGFTKDVLEESRRQPVLVDFWAPWCGPCKQLTPVLEKVVNEGQGRVKLVKMNIDDHPSIPGQLGIQSIPAVIAFVDGRPVDGFMGAVPESQVRQFIDKLAGPPGAEDAAEIEGALAEAEAFLVAGDIQDAAQLYGAVLQADPENAKAAAGMIQCLIAMGETARASQMLASLPEELAKEPAIQAVAKKLEQIEEARKLGDPVALERQLDANPDDHDARLKLAKILNVQGERDKAAEHLLTIMRKDRTFDDDGARRQLLAFFDVWGPKDPATIAARRRLSSILFS
ncbi:thioredoxin [Neorhizobium galegae]|uniref:thioredoxin n=1 Tax=Neorhizobium galegae TaxID=399 RepID=UPI0006218C9A|nr:thioredoxin [Neorhizobium galegae]CDZ27205.1 Thioredoxin [Neorhizobium galegae bv. officinalis]KAA9385049.1 thioredoxin [Neorhizobium galegae]KAB1110611.1 thioredoxin [Neorhizobium galegae]MCM2497783.1 thioredoxin [Neorhizobium galegae]MCQ1773661.1 thioredoxin [Neorhizobium galegae]